MDEQRPTDGVEVNIGGTMFTLRYPLSAMREAKREFGGSITDIKVLHAMDEDKLGKLIWYGVRANHPDVTVEQIEDLLDPRQMQRVLAAYAEAVSASLPKAEAPAQDLIEELKNLMARAEALTETMKSTGSASGPEAGTTSGSPTQSSGV